MSILIVACYYDDKLHVPAVSMYNHAHFDMKCYKIKRMLKGFRKFQPSSRICIEIIIKSILTDDSFIKYS